jgi:hypothetical protein
MTTPQLLSPPGAPASDAGAFPYRSPIPMERPVAPFDARDLGLTATLPHRAVEIVLVDRERLAKTIGSGAHLGRLTLILATTSTLFALPFGAVLGADFVFHVALLLLGSVLLCVPSLHVFSGYLGCRMTIAQNIVVALLVSAVGSMFTLGFAPIVWFVLATTEGGDGSVQALSVALLAVALVAGLIHLNRIVMSDAALRPSGAYRLVMAGWQLLFVYVALRMADFLGLT